jgi:hypothetical protein
MMIKPLLTRGSNQQLKENDWKPPTSRGGRSKLSALKGRESKLSSLKKVGSKLLSIKG